MKIISLLPADVYTVVNKTVLTEVDRKNLISLYEPIIGPTAVSLYFILWQDLGKQELISNDFTHHHLMTLLKTDLDIIKTAREALEAMGLLKTYLKTGDINSYVYELYSPLSAADFFNHPIFNIVLYNNIGKNEYEMLKIEHEKIIMNLRDYEDISKTLNTTFKSGTKIEPFDVKDRETLDIRIDKQIDFDLLIESLPKGYINEKAFNKTVRELINNLAFIYNLDTLKMIDIVRTNINEKGFIDREALRKRCRNYYQYENDGELPTLLYKSQPEYLRAPEGDLSNRGKIIRIFETTSPYKFLVEKTKTGFPTQRDLKVLEVLIIDYELKPAVVNVLIDYVLKRDNNKLSMPYIETIAGQWKRLGIETASAAMDIAEKEHKKYSKKSPRKVNSKTETKQPVWFNENIEREVATNEEKAELEEFLKEFR